MNEYEPLLGSLKATGEEGTHQIPIDRLYLKLSTSKDGLSTSQAKVKRHSVGLNSVKPPITAPAWLCCLLPCLLSTNSMKKYNECVPDYGFVKRNGKWIKLDATSIVPGDILRIERGERVPADLRIINVRFLMLHFTSNVHQLQSGNIMHFRWICNHGQKQANCV
jgi:hypothetical protein